jgi:hypothetical protein
MRRPRLLRALLVLASFVLLSCGGGGGEEESAADYSVLGIASVTVDGERLAVTQGCLLDLSGTRTVLVNGVENQITKKHLELSYAVRTAPGAAMSIQVETGYPDVAVTVDDQQEAAHGALTVVVRRPGHAEQITYVFRKLVLA